MEASFNGTRPLALTKRQAVGGSSSSGRDLLIDTDSVETAYERLLDGEQPPLMPSECRAPGSRKNMVRM